MLSIEEIKKILEKPLNRATIAAAVEHEDRLRLHCETAIHRAECSPAIGDFEKWVKTCWPEAFDKWQGMLRFPLKTVSDTKKAFDGLSKVWDGQNPAYNVEFTIPERSEEWKRLRGEKKIYDRWRTEGFERMKTSINSIVVVDLPREQKGTSPDPYFYWVDICQVIDYKVMDGLFEYLIFRVNDNEIAVLDKDGYQLFNNPKKDPKTFILISANPHDLGYTPAKWFWSTSTSLKRPDLKLSPISEQLGNLDYLLMYKVGKDYADGYMSFPITSSYDSDCSYQHRSEDGTYCECDGGYLKDGSGTYMTFMDGAVVRGVPCPICSSRRFNGPGTHVYVPKESKNQDVPNMLESVKITTYPKADIEYLPEEIERRERMFYQNVTGYAGEVSTKQAMNEPQVQAAFESRETKILDLKKNFEIIIQWVDQTMCKLIYGDQFVSLSVSLGTEFYQYTASVEDAAYQAAKAAKESSVILDFLDDQRWKARYRNNPQELVRVTIENHLDPLRHIDSQNEIDKAYQSGILDWDGYNIKLNFSTFVKRFTREQAPLTEFGKGLPLEARVNKIYEILKTYGQTKPEPVPVESGKPAFA